MTGLLSKFCAILLVQIAFAQVWSNEVENNGQKLEEKECYGRRNGLGLTGSPHLHYQRIRRHYANCTFLRGSLEITHLDDPNILYDLSFLSSIRVVTGYVLIALVTENVSISLDSLEVIRGDDPFVSGSRAYGLFVALNVGRGGNSKNGLQSLRMPNLREISNGDVFFAKTPHIPYVTTIDWNVIAPDDRTSLQDFPKIPPRCHHVCEQSGGGPHCWGPGIEDCQAVLPAIDSLRCHPSCPGRCHMAISERGCCPEACAGGCFGQEHVNCVSCKYARYLDTCVESCPPDTFLWAGICEL